MTWRGREGRLTYQQELLLEIVVVREAVGTPWAPVPRTEKVPHKDEVVLLRLSAITAWPRETQIEFLL